MITSFIQHVLLLLIKLSSKTIQTRRIEPSALHPNDIAAWPLHAGLGSSWPGLGDRFSRPTPELIIRAGYPVETHQVVTGDGYILSLHRIPVYSQGSHKRPPVFLQHGLLSSSADWVVTGPGHGLAFQLAEAGYDVWMGNFRGNTYSKGHLRPDISDKEYWTFTWDEHAEYDLPAMLDHVLEVTGAEEYHYIGHSMGTLTYFTACNYNAWVCSRSRLMVGYGPHTSVPHLTSPLFRLLSLFSSDIQWLLEHIGLYQFAPSNWLTQLLADQVCDRADLGLEICENVMFLVAGYNAAEMNSSTVPYILGHVPAGSSSLNMIHYSQSVTSGQWAGYDWGDPGLNTARWGQPSPPVYQYSNITSPVALFWSDGDILVVPRDVASLASSLPNLVLNHEMEEKAYTHVDFLWGIHNHQDLYRQTLDLMDKY